MPTTVTKGIEIKNGDIIKFSFLDENNKVCKIEEATIKTIEHYNADLYLVSFVEKQGSYAFLIQELYSMKVNK